MALPHSSPPVALTIAGTDSGGGAGVSADLHTFAAYGVFGTLVVTAVTAQNTTGVSGVVAQTPSMLQAQLSAVLEDLPVVAVKTGMLANRELVEVVTSWAERGALPQLVVDPVMVATSGGRLLEADAHLAYRALIAQAALVTPNVPEAELLCGEKILDHSDLAEAARILVRLGAAAALVKGGHLKGRESVDVLCHGGGITEFRAPRIDSANTHGTGCTLSAAITAGLAIGLPLVAAVARAKRYVTAAITSAANWELGAGAGPLDHGVWNNGPRRS